MTITSLTQLQSKLSVGQEINLNISGGAWYSVNSDCTNINKNTSVPFGTFAVPTAYTSGGQIYNKTTINSGYPYWTDATGSDSTYIGRVDFSSYAWSGKSILVYDLLWAASGFVGNVTTAQSVVGFAGLPTRASTGVGAEIWLGCSTAIGATAHNVTAQYTNTVGTSGISTVSVSGIPSMGTTAMKRLPLALGDQGVQSVQSLTLSVSSGTAGNLWVMLVKPVLLLPIIPDLNSFNFTRDSVSFGIQKIPDSSVLLFMGYPGNLANTTGQISVIMNIIQG